MVRSNEELATLYAAMREIERQIQDKVLPPGTYDVSNTTIIINLPSGTNVSRDPGTNGDGKVERKATSNLYGFSVWACFLKRLALFNQAQAVREIITAAWREAVSNSTHVETELLEIDPEIASVIKELKDAPKPMRSQDTTRNVTRPKDAIATIKVSKTLQTAA